MRFRAALGVDVRVVQWLNEHGYDAIHLRDENLHRLPNGEIFEKATRETRILLTFDLDFGEIAALARGRPVTVVLFRLHNTRAFHVTAKWKAFSARPRRRFSGPRWYWSRNPDTESGICRSARPSRKSGFVEDNENTRSRRRIKLDGWLNRISWLRPNWCPVPFFTLDDSLY